MKYRVELENGQEGFIMHADFTQASAPLEFEVDGDVCPTPFQTADAQHDEYVAAQRVQASIGAVRP